jgi:hypothetical protein
VTIPRLRRDHARPGVTTGQACSRAWKPSAFGRIYLPLFVTSRDSVRSAADVSLVNAAYRHRNRGQPNDGFLMVADRLTWRISSCSLKFIYPVGPSAWPRNRGADDDRT